MTESVFQRRARELRKKKIKRYTLAGLGVTALIVGIWFFGFSTTMRITAVEVSGNDLVSAAAIEKVARLDQNLTLARVNTDQIAENVRKVPQIDDVQIKRGWPRTLKIIVTERNAIAWYESGNRYQVFDAEGVTFKKSKSKPKGLVEVRPVKADGKSKVALHNVAQTITYVADNSPKLFKQIRFIEVGGQDRITLIMKDRSSVKWGSAERLADKLAVLTTLRTIKARVYDVSAPNQPTTRK